MTWTFENPVQYGTFISGDYWVIGPVNIVSVTPDNEPGYHGAEKNVSSSTQQPYDERLSTYST